jgi:hypothetical protein
MVKRCVRIPGVMCVENMTLFIIFIVFILLIYISIAVSRTGGVGGIFGPNVVVLASPSYSGESLDTLSDPYAPPLKEEYKSRKSSWNFDPRGIPINIRSRGSGASYSQMGILKKSGGGGVDGGNDGSSNTILPLFGRKADINRDKYQYYAMSNTGTINTKLPVSLSGQQCMSESGCGEINTGDSVYVDGYDGTFTATIYENSLYRYLPW